MEKRLDQIASFLTYLLIGSLLIAVFLFVSSCGDDNDSGDPRDKMFNSLKGTWVVESVVLDDQELQGYEEFNVTFDETNTPFLYRYECSNLPSLGPWKAAGTWEFGSDIDVVMKRDGGTEDELNIAYVLENGTLTINFIFAGDGYSNTRQESATGNWLFVLRR